MITSLRLINFKAHSDTSIGLGRFTALVGDNASGKTSVLEALELLGETDGGTVLNRVPDVLRRGCERSRVEASGATRGEQVADVLEIAVGPAQPPFTAARNTSVGARTFAAVAPGGSDWTFVRKGLGTSMLYRLSAAAVASAALVGASNDRLGGSTGSVLAALKLADDATFERIEAALRRLVPTVEHVRIKQGKVLVSGQYQVANQIWFDFRGAAGVPAHGASQGTLVLLALLTVLHGPGRPNLVLLDDLEHTLHPRAQMELVRLIKSLLSLDEFFDVQVVATTHSPYVLDEMEVADVHAFAIGDDGCVRSKPLSAHPEAERSKGTLTAGQLWSLDPERTWVLKE